MVLMLAVVCLDPEERREGDEVAQAEDNQEEVDWSGSDDRPRPLAVNPQEKASRRWAGGRRRGARVEWSRDAGDAGDDQAGFPNQQRGPTIL